MITFLWAGGVLFVAALALTGYTFGVTWSRALPFDASAIAVDALLFSVFAVHHSVFARESVKRRLTSVVPEPMLRSAYVWLASLLLITVCLAWRPIGGELYSAHGFAGYALTAVQVAGIVVIFQAVRVIDPLELAGIRPHSGTEALQIVGPYRQVRHPIYSGWLLLTFGPAHMTGDRLIFAVISTVYLLIAMRFEERSLRMSFGRAYDEYKRRVRYRVVPYVY